LKEVAMSDAVERHIAAALDERAECVRLVELARQRKARGVKIDGVLESARIAHRKCFTLLQIAIGMMAREADRDLDARIYAGWQWEGRRDKPRRSS
jgi:hypothetical protein